MDCEKYALHGRIEPKMKKVMKIFFNKLNN